MTNNPAPVINFPYLRYDSAQSASGSLLTEFVMKRRAPKANIPIKPHEIPNTGSTLYWALPKTSSQEKTVALEHTFPPSLILNVIQVVWTETTKPVRATRFIPIMWRPRAKFARGLMPDNDWDNESPIFVISESPNTTGTM